jgi:nucleoside-diphosphate-sugar epimerase
MKTCFFIFGLGYTASFLAQELVRLDVPVIGTSRDKNKMITPVHVSLIDFSSHEVEIFLKQASHVLVTIPPSKLEGDMVLNHWQHLITRYAKSIQWLGYLSSTGVYGDHQGAWVDETSPSIALGEQSRLRLDAENQWMSFAKEQQLPLHVFRLAGIYGPQRNALERIRSGKHESIFKEGQFFSRIHVADIVKTIMASMQKPHPFSIYNVADDEPAPSYLVDDFAAQLLHRPSLTLVPYEKASLSPMERQFYANNRRVLNNKIKNELSVELTFPTYREGLTALYNQLCQSK